LVTKIVRRNSSLKRRDTVESPILWLGIETIGK
jgi:hypothetical protein